MVKENFKQIDLLRKRRETSYFPEPYFIDTKKFIKKGIFSGLVLIAISAILGTPFIFRIKFLENKKDEIKLFSDEYDLLKKDLDIEKKQLKKIEKFNNDLKESIINISSSSAFLQEIAFIIPKEIQLMEFTSKGDSLFMKAKLFNDNYLEILNSFLLVLDKSELIKFDEIDLKEIKVSEQNAKDKSYTVDINTKVSTKYNEINEKYLIKLGSYGLFNRLNILKSIDNLNL